MNTNTSSASSCHGYHILLNQRNKYNHYNAPPARVETPSPYLKNTANDLNMRRKAEVLKYKNNAQNTKTNNLTKKQNYALLSRGIVNELSQYTISALNNPVLQPYYYGYDPINIPGLLPIGTQVSVTGIGFFFKLFNVAGKIYNTTIQYDHYCSLGTIQNIVNNDIDHPVYSILYTDGTTDDVSGMNITSMQVKTPPCDSNKIVYTWSSASNVPGSPILLYLDPSIPLYNYIVNFQSSFGNTVSTDTSVLKLYTTNELDYVLKTLDIMEQGDNTKMTPYQSRNSPIGTIILTNNVVPSIYTFNISIPIGIWFIGSIGYGILDVSNYSDILTDYNKHLRPHIDASGRYLDYEDYCYSKHPGIFRPSDVINFHIINNMTDLNITYSSDSVKSSYSLQSTFTDVSFSPYGVPNGHFYGIQYVGNLTISNLQISVQPLDVFDLNVQLSYSYNYDIADKLDYFQTGLFFNLSSINQSSCQGITFKSKPPVPYIKSTFDTFTPGSIILSHTPYIIDADISNTSKAFPTYIQLNNLNGNFQTLNIERISNTGLKQSYFNITGNSFIDRFLLPSDISFGKISSYTYAFTPVFNHMFGTTLTIGPIKTPALTISGSVDITGIVTNSIPFKDISGTFSYYCIQRDIFKNNIFIFDSSINNLTKSFYTDIGLIAGATYRYTLIPYFTDPYNYTIRGHSYKIPGTYTTRNIYMNTVYDTITPSYVKLQILDYVFDTFTIIRDGIPTKMWFNLTTTDTQYMSQDPSKVLLFFTDNDPGLIQGNSYTYSTIPTRNGIDGKRTFLTSPLKYRSPNIMNSATKIVLPTINIYAKIGTITPTYIQIIDISGLYTSFSVQRIGSDMSFKNIDMSGVYYQYTDTSQNGLISGNNYTYSLIPSFQSKVGSTFVLPNTVFFP